MRTWSRVFGLLTTLLLVILVALTTILTPEARASTVALPCDVRPGEISCTDSAVTPFSARIQNTTTNPYVYDPTYEFTNGSAGQNLHLLQGCLTAEGFKALDEDGDWKVEIQVTLGSDGSALGPLPTYYTQWHNARCGVGVNGFYLSAAQITANNQTWYVYADTGKFYPGLIDPDDTTSTTIPPTTTTLPPIGGCDLVVNEFSDVPCENIYVMDIDWLAEEGITRGCNPPTNDRFCPDEPVTRGQMAAFLVRALGYVDDGGGNTFIDDNDSVFEADIARLAEVGVTRGCNPPANDRFCPDEPVTRGQMAAFLVRALGYTDAGSVDFVDDNGSVFEANIEALAASGVTRGCNPPANDRFCPDEPVTRGQMAAFLHRALG